MKHNFFYLTIHLSITLLLAVFSEFVSASEAPSFNWPSGAKAAISLAYDDALDSHLDNAIPDLNKYGFKGSFYLVLNAPSYTNRTNEWRLAASNGHELGNHTIYHACRGSLPNREWVKPDNDLDKKSVYELIVEVKLANEVLYALDGETQRTFTVPCLDYLASGENYVSHLYPLFVGIKGNSGNVPKTMANVNTKNITVMGPVGSSGEELINHAKQAAKYGTMANFTFHGIGGDHLTVSRRAHEALLIYLKNNQNIYWVDTFRNISNHINNSLLNKNKEE